MKALELAEEYADAVAAHRLENLYGTSKSYTPEKAKERVEAFEALATELRRLAAVEAERDQLRAARIAYASEFPPIPDGDDAGMPAVDRIHENIRRLKAELERIKALPPVAWEVYVAEADNAYVVESLEDPQLIDDCTNSDAVVTPLYALGSKT